MMEKGKVKFFNGTENKRYGFIRTSKGEELFFHFGDGARFRAGQFDTTKSPERDPRKGDEIVFLRKRGRKGPKAKPWGFAEDYASSLRNVYYDLTEKMIERASFPPEWKRYLVSICSIKKSAEELTSILVTSPLTLLEKSIKEKDERAEELVSRFKKALRENEDIVSKCFLQLMEKAEKTFLNGGDSKAVMELEEFDQMIEIVRMLTEHPGSFPVQTFESEVSSKGRWVIPLERGVKIPDFSREPRKILFFPDPNDWKDKEPVEIEEITPTGRPRVSKGVFYSPALKKYAVISCYYQGGHLHRDTTADPISWSDRYLYVFTHGFVAGSTPSGERPDYGDEIARTPLDNYFCLTKGKILPIEVRKDPGDFRISGEKCIPNLERYRQFFSPSLNVYTFSECVDYGRGWKPYALGRFGKIFWELKKDRLVVYTTDQILLERAGIEPK